MLKIEETLQVFRQAQLVLFDFDGVLVDSNKAKSCAFIEISRKLDPELLSPTARFLEENPSSTRFQVIDYLLELKGHPDVGLRQRLLADYSFLSKKLVKALKISDSLHNLRECDNRIWGLVSATERGDLKELCGYHNITEYFQAGIFGSPETKENNIRKALKMSLATASKTVYLGDRLSDSRAAKAAGVNFIFVQGWSDAKSSEILELAKNPSIRSIGDLVA